MFDLARKSFAKHGDSFFLEETGGVLIVSEAVLEKRHKDIQKKKWFLFSKRQKALSALVAQLQAPASFLLTCDLPNEAVLLTDQTTVTLSNIEISVELFLVLLEKTRVTVNENFFIAKHNDNEDCIKENGMMGETPFCLERSWVVVSPLALENIERMAPNSIGCVLEKIYLSDTGLINILPKLRIRGDCEVEHLRLSAREKEHVAEVLAQETPFCVGRVKNMWLTDYAVGVITKMSLKDCGFEWLCLTAARREHVDEVLAQEKPFCVGRVKNMRLWDYAASVITKMTTHEDNTMESFVWAGNEGQLSRILKEGDNSIDLGRIRTGGFDVPERIKRKLRYTLVDGEGKEVLEEEEPGQRGNLLE
ncbi:MAG: uncharacterized protein A8A55_0835 [Amphiamblys sp. WSBS2006]|nr:MAG: uncharacterized protein A8A55_0835 [Amphiamblys sp. WSBS2006]